jgi:phosphoglycerate dehydrogenase-like enzyme
VRITGYELHGKTLAILGLGRIGREMALRARAFGMKVVGYGHHWDEDFATAHGISRAVDLDELLRQADALTLHTKLTPETHHLLNARNLALLRPTAIIVNTGRGELIDQAALVAALQERRLLGYGADVLDQEPPPPNHPLLGLPNVVITPHIGSRTHESVQRQAGAAVENLLLLLSGRPALAQANPSVPPPAAMAFS